MKGSRALIAALAALCLPSCTSDTSVDVKTEPSPVLDDHFDAAARAFDVPVDLLKAISYVETRWQHVAGEEHDLGRPAGAGVFGLWGENLDRGAAAAGFELETVRDDLEANIHAAAARLAELARKTRETISKATSDVRRAINSLMDETPTTKDLCARLRDTLDEVASQHDFESVWRSDADSAPDCSPQTAEQVYNITREALVNAARHANAKQVSLQVGRSNENYFVTVEDDGNGFDTTQPAPGGHFGLQIMQARAKHIGGEIEVQSTPESGTHISLRWAVEKEKQTG